MATITVLCPQNPPKLSFEIHPLASSLEEKGGPTSIQLKRICNVQYEESTDGWIYRLPIFDADLLNYIKFSTPVESYEIISKVECIRYYSRMPIKGEKICRKSPLFIPVYFEIAILVHDDVPPPSIEIEVQYLGKEAFNIWKRKTEHQVGDDKFRITEFCYERSELTRGYERSELTRGYERSELTRGYERSE